MMILTALRKPEQWEWMRERTHVIRCEDSQGIVAIDRGRIVAMAVFDSFTVDACCVHMAIDKPMVLRHGFLEAIAYHLFEICGRTRIFGMVPDNNAKAIKLDSHIGFKEIARVPNAVAEGVGYIIFDMHKRDCKYLPAELREAA